MTLEELLLCARAIRPDVQYVIRETYCGNVDNTKIYWAHASRQAWTGETPVALLEDIRGSITEVA